MKSGTMANPIVDLEDDAMVIYGQNNLNRKPTALDRVGVRRLMLYIEKTIRQRFHNRKIKPYTWSELVDVLFINMYEVLDDVKSRKGLADFSIERPFTESKEPTTIKATLTPIRAVNPIVLSMELTPDVDLREEV